MCPIHHRRYGKEALEAAAIGGVYASMGGPVAAATAAAGAAAASVAATAFTRATDAVLDHYGISTSDLQSTALGTAAGLAIDAVQIATSSRRRKEFAVEMAGAAREAAVDMAADVYQSLASSVSDWWSGRRLQGGLPANATAEFMLNLTRVAFSAVAPDTVLADALSWYSDVVQQLQFAQTVVRKRKTATSIAMGAAGLSARAALNAYMVAQGLQTPLSVLREPAEWEAFLQATLIDTVGASAPCLDACFGHSIAPNDCSAAMEASVTTWARAVAQRQVSAVVNSSRLMTIDGAQNATCGAKLTAMSSDARTLATCLASCVDAGNTSQSCLSECVHRFNAAIVAIGGQSGIQLAELQRSTGLLQSQCLSPEGETQLQPISPINATSRHICPPSSSAAHRRRRTAAQTSPDQLLQLDSISSVVTGSHHLLRQMQEQFEANASAEDSVGPFPGGIVMVLSDQIDLDTLLEAEFARVDDGTVVPGTTLAVLRGGAQILIPPSLVAPAVVNMTVRGNGGAWSFARIIEVSPLPDEIVQQLSNDVNGTLCIEGQSDAFEKYQDARSYYNGIEPITAGLWDADLTLAELIMMMQLYNTTRQSAAMHMDSLAILGARLMVEPEACTQFGRAVRQMRLLRERTLGENATDDPPDLVHLASMRLDESFSLSYVAPRPSFADDSALMLVTPNVITVRSLPQNHMAIKPSTHGSNGSG